MIRQFILDDKGYVVICGWGLPKFSARNSEQLAVSTGLAFTNPAQLGHAANVTVGITFGRVYCGQVGGEMRKEYAMVGDTVNTAARLMASKASPMLVDYHVKTSTSSRCACTLLLAAVVLICRGGGLLL
jgi:class 3 adenylate cyclase